MEQFSSTHMLVSTLAPSQPITCHRPTAALDACGSFLQLFPGKILYAVKTNPEPIILRALYDAGLRNFDVTSISEIELIATLFPDATANFMHPVKNRQAITAAYHEYGVRTFALDSVEELEKIRAATNNAKDLTLMVRVTVPNIHAAYRLSDKFGVPLADAPAVLKAVHSRAQKLGICFHVGSQCMQPAAYGTALRIVGDMVRRAGVILDIIDVGGGFPAPYPGMIPPPLEDYMDEIKAGFDLMPIPDHCEFWAEPGRALVADAGSTLVLVEGRKDRQLYINDGTYGSLFDAGVPGFRFPVKCIRPSCEPEPDLIDFSFYGPTCDSQDAMTGPFALPIDISEGDYVEIGLTGAYGAAMRTHFNGFHSDHEVVLHDQLSWLPHQKYASQALVKPRKVAWKILR